VYNLAVAGALRKNTARMRSVIQARGSRISVGAGKFFGVLPAGGMAGQPWVGGCWGGPLSVFPARVSGDPRARHPPASLPRAEVSQGARRIQAP